MNEKFNKTEVWGELGGGKVESAPEEEEYEEDEHVEDEIPEPESDKKTLYKKDDFFDELSCDALDRERERGERTKFSEQRKIDTETFGAFPVRSRGGRGRGGRGGGYRGGYFGGGGGSYGIGRGGNGYGRGRGSGRPGSAIQ
jgi:protein LSM14